MEEEKFLEWLIDNKHMSKRSAKDVISRARRVCSIMNCKNLEETNIEELNLNKVFEEKSMFVKSQLRRCCSLFAEYKKEALR